MSKSQSPEAKDGVYNPRGLGIVAIAPVYVAMIPVTSWLTRPGGLFESVLTKFLHSVNYVATAGASSAMSDRAIIPALATIYMVTAFGFTGAFSVAGVTAGSQRGRSNNHPRLAERDIKGLPLRLKSAHLNLIENFSPFAMAASLAAIYAPTDRQALNLLGLHVIGKLLVFYPAYVMNVAPVRSISYLISTCALFNVTWTVAKSL